MEQKSVFELVHFHSFHFARAVINEIFVTKLVSF